MIKLNHVLPICRNLILCAIKIGFEEFEANHHFEISSQVKEKRTFL